MSNITNNDISSDERLARVRTAFERALRAEQAMSERVQVVDSRRQCISQQMSHASETGHHAHAALDTLRSERIRCEQAYRAEVAAVAARREHELATVARLADQQQRDAHDKQRALATSAHQIIANETTAQRLRASHRQREDEANEATCTLEATRARLEAVLLRAQQARDEAKLVGVLIDGQRPSRSSTEAQPSTTTCSKLRRFFSPNRSRKNATTQRSPSPPSQRHRRTPTFALPVCMTASPSASTIDTTTPTSTVENNNSNNNIDDNDEDDDDDAFATTSKQASSSTSTSTSTTLVANTLQLIANARHHLSSTAPRSPLTSKAIADEIDGVLGQLPIARHVTFFDDNVTSAAAALHSTYRHQHEHVDKEGEAATDDVLDRLAIALTTLRTKVESVQHQPHQPDKADN